MDATPQQLFDACMRYRHDFGLLPDDERAAMARDATRWLDAWQVAFDQDDQVTLPEAIELLDHAKADTARAVERMKAAEAALRLQERPRTGTAELEPTYYVMHPDGSASVADPQPAIARPALAPEQAELAEYRAAVAEWAKRCEWGADSWKREPYNAALFALAAREAERKQREEARAGK